MNTKLTKLLLDLLLGVLYFVFLAAFVMAAWMVTTVFIELHPWPLVCLFGGSMALSILTRRTFAP